MMAFLSGLLSGIVSGITTVLILWGWKNYLFIPKVFFGHDICKIDYGTDTNGYAFIFQNTGRRHILDFKVNASLYLPGILPWDTNISRKFTIPTAINRFILKGNPVSTRFRFEECAELFSCQHIPSTLKLDIQRKKDALEKIFAFCPRAYLIVYIMGYDEQTGIRKVFESKPYRREDIKCGTFDRKSLKATAEQSE